MQTSYLQLDVHCDVKLRFLNYAFSYDVVLAHFCLTLDLVQWIV